MSDITEPNRTGRDIPPIAISRTTTEVNHTGSWKYITPRYEDRVAPCNANCPVGIDIEGYLYLLGQGRTAEAAALLLEQGDDVTGVTMRVAPAAGGAPECVHDARRAARRILSVFAMLVPPNFITTMLIVISLSGSTPSGRSRDRYAGRKRRRWPP